MRKMFCCVVLVMVFIFCSVSVGKADQLSELKAQMQKIKEENNALQEQLERQGEEIERLLKRMEEAEISGLADIPKLKIKGFSDIGFTANITDSEDSNTFTLGAVDFFITSKVAERVSFLTESHFYFNTDTNSQDFHLERVNLKYSFSDLFNIKIGKMHTPLGYWNQAFHHGFWLQTTAFRPEIYLFGRDDGGFLPVHSVGIELLGTKEFDAFDLEYNLGILNGRGRTRTEIQNAKDKNDSKAVNLLLSLKPNFVQGLKLGANVYYDKIPSNPPTATRANRIDELIVGGYVTYIHDKIELLGELFNVYHDDKTSGNGFDSSGFYLQGGYNIDKFTPYYRFDFIDFENGDPYFTPIDIDIMKHTAGLRWDIFSWNALKFEYSFSDKKDKDNEHSLTVNNSFAF